MGREQKGRSGDGSYGNACYALLYVRGKVSEASVKHAAVGLGFESEQPLLGQVFRFALASSSLAIPSARIKIREIRGLCVVKSLAVP